MPYDFHWHDEEHGIIRLDIDGVVTWDGMYIAVDNICSELGKRSDRVDIIFNVKVGMPKGNPMPHLKAVMNKLASHKNLGLIANVSSVGMSSFSKTMREMVTGIMGFPIGKTFFADSFNHAIEVIQKDRLEQSKTSIENELK